MNHSLVVGGLQARRGGDRDVQRVTNTKLAELIEPILSTLSVDEFDGCEVNTLLAIDCVDLHDILMVQLRHRSRFTNEAFYEVLALRQFPRQSLQRDDAVKTDLSREIDHSHTALAELLL